MSRAKFDAIIDSLWENSSHGTDRKSVEDAFRAGRESMRDEAEQVCDDLCQNDALAFDCREAVKRIKL